MTPSLSSLSAWHTADAELRELAPEETSALRALASASTPSLSSTSSSRATGGGTGDGAASVAMTARVGGITAATAGSDTGGNDSGMYGLYRRGLLYYEIPVGPDDRFSIPPLEGFVSNRWVWYYTVHHNQMTHSIRGLTNGGV